VTKPRSAPVPPLLVPMVQGIDVSPLLAVLIPYLERLEEAVSQITTEVKKLSGKLDAAAERAKKTAADLRDQIAELKAKVEAAGNDPETLDLIDKMTKTADAIDPEVPATLPPDDAPPEPAPAGWSIRNVHGIFRMAGRAIEAPAEFSTSLQHRPCRSGVGRCSRRRRLNPWPARPAGCSRRRRPGAARCCSRSARTG
jgi:hypothetical protein